MRAASRPLRVTDVSRRERIASIGVAILAAAFYLLWEIAHRGIFDYSRRIYPIDDADEWRYIACSRLIAHGYSMFTEVFSAQPPLLFGSLAAGMHVFGDSIAGARWVEILFGLVGLLSAGCLAWLLAGPVAGAATSLLLAVSPGYLSYSHTIEAEGPMMAMLTLSLMLAAAYARYRSRWFALLSGLSLAAAVLLKLFALEALVPGLWLVLFYRGTVRQNAAAAFAYLCAAALPLALNFGLFHRPEQWDQVVRLHERASRLTLPNVTPPLQILRDLFTLDLGLTILAVAGLAVLVLGRRKGAAVFLAVWVVGMAGMLLLFRPLFPHHASILLTGLATTAGIGLAEGLRALRERVRVVITVSLLASLAYLVLVPRLIHADRHLLVSTRNQAALGLTALIEKKTSPNDFVAPDDLRLAELAHRLVPPPLCDPSTVRYRAGYLGAKTVIAATVRYHVRAVVPQGIFLQVPGYLDWVRAHYSSVRASSGSEIYLRR